MKSEAKKILAFLLGLAFVFYYTMFGDLTDSYGDKSKLVTTDLKVYFIDVGQADSILISNSNFNMLIDAGNNEDGPKLVTYFKEELNIEKFDYVVGTHPHEDHIGGLDDIINNFKIDNILLPDATTTTKTFEDVLDTIANKKLEITIPEVNSEFNLGEAKLKVIYTGTDESDLNNTSIVLKMTFGNFSYLFTGDATSKTENIILEKDIDVDILKVGHHGSSYSSSELFLSKVTPKYAIISAGENNSYNHPTPETIERIKKHTNEIYTTNELGTILLTSDGTNIKFDNFQTDTNG